MVLGPETLKVPVTTTETFAKGDVDFKAQLTKIKASNPDAIVLSALIAEARSADELAFVLGHEAGHHIAGHIPKREEQALSGALLAGVIADAGDRGTQDGTYFEIDRQGNVVKRYSPMVTPEDIAPDVAALL